MKMELELKKYVDEDKQKDKQLFEQQLKLITYEDQLTQNYTDRSKFMRQKESFNTLRTGTSIFHGRHLVMIEELLEILDEVLSSIFIGS